MNSNIWSSGSIDKAVGKAKEEVGKRMSSEELEFKGKVQQMQGDAKNLLEDAKDTVLKKTNDFVDQFKHNN
jgi:uncharacterized protein YjbJ (UPF0337 family)